jgi:hypothetical protein
VLLLKAQAVQARRCAFHKNGTAVSLIDGQRFR